MAEATMGDQFRGLPMSDLIGGPLMAASEAQVKLAYATADFIKVIGFLPPPEQSKNGYGDVRTAHFQFDRPSGVRDDKGIIPFESVELEVPLLAIVKIPSLGIDTVDVTFDMEVKTSETDTSGKDASAAVDAGGGGGWGPFSVKVSISGSVSSHQEHTRQTDKSAKYHVEVHAKDDGMPEGLARVLDIVQSSVAPTKIEPKKLPSPGAREADERR